MIVNLRVYCSNVLSENINILFINTSLFLSLFRVSHPLSLSRQISSHQASLFCSPGCADYSLSPCHLIQHFNHCPSTHLTLHFITLSSNRRFKGFWVWLKRFCLQNLKPKLRQCLGFCVLLVM